MAVDGSVHQEQRCVSPHGPELSASLAEQSDATRAGPGTGSHPGSISEQESWVSPIQ